MKPFQLYISILLLGLLLKPSFAENLETQVFSDIVIQDGGRLKPLDTFARNSLLAIQQASKIKKDKLSAMDWMGQLLLHPEISYQRKDFKIREPEVLEALGIAPQDDHLYSFDELRKGMNGIMTDLQAWFQKEDVQRSLVEQQVVRLYSVLGQYYQISRSLTVFTKDLSIDNEALAKDFDLKVGEMTSYLHFHRYADKLRDEVTRLSNVPENSRDERDKSLLRLVTQMSDRIQDQTSSQLNIIPSPPSVVNETWASPWALMGEKNIDAWTWERLLELQNLHDALVVGKLQEAQAQAEAFKAGVAHRSNMGLELFYNKADLFTNSLVFDLIAFIFLMCSWMFWPRALRTTAMITAFIGLGLHGAGIVLRMLMMGRPPVSTLYESIIFVGFIAMAMCMILEVVRRNGIGIFCGTVLASILHFIGFGYADDGDTMGMLVAVLNSNFWLATHVVTITMGYGITVVAGLVGHLYFIMAIIKPTDKAGLKEIYKNAIGLSLVALLFTTLGTILGGIWADQSWGRFWGWDPKENGAMLIVLWLLMLLHGRISGEMKALGFSAGLILGNIVVALAWFGVNLLSVGLHNYGFTESIKSNLILFCSIEVVLALVGYVIAGWRLRQTNTVME
jgi:ABC-type transport system involved in cytochrome c biogenesis permease subunit